MLPEPLDSPQARLNVARRASPTMIEAAFARRYKAARLAADAEAQRQALNAALTTLRDPAGAAAAEADSYWLALDPDRALPEPDDLVEELLPWPEADPLAAVAGPSAGELIAAEVAGTPPPAGPSDEALRTWLLANLALDRIDPWEDLT